MGKQDEKRINEIPPYMNSDWSMNKETYTADSQRNRTSSLNKLKQDEGKFISSFISIRNDM